MGIKASHAFQEDMVDQFNPLYGDRTHISWHPFSSLKIIQPLYEDKVTIRQEITYQISFNPLHGDKSRHRSFDTVNHESTLCMGIKG